MSEKVKKSINPDFNGKIYASSRFKEATRDVLASLGAEARQLGRMSDEYVREYVRSRNNGA